MPHLALDIFNKSKTDTSYCWVMLLKIGPFDEWSKAVSFLNLWTDKTRGKTRRMERGLELFAMYGHAHKLSLWGQSQTQEEILENEAKQPPRKRVKKPTVSSKPKKQKIANDLAWKQEEIQNLFYFKQANDAIEKLRLMHEKVESATAANAKRLQNK